jgi:hypothetical protein
METVPEPRYTSQYYDTFQEIVRRSARVIVPIVLELLEPSSVCDVGCGRGTWLSVFSEHGVSDIYGIDGDYVKRDELEIPPERFAAADLRTGVKVDRRFDLCTCLEVAEHLPEESAAALVDGLVEVAPAVLFSGAIPGQGGRGHVNEQWPDYWGAHFERHGYIAVDCIRPRIWNLHGVPFWYAQNTFVFVEPAALGARPELEREHDAMVTHTLPLVHPHLLASAAKRPWIRLKRFKENRDSGAITQEEFEAQIAKWASQV